jgi:dTDP-4-amino-4,6-dideoxygalactose transaminase
MKPLPFKSPIFVTRPFLPPLPDFIRGLKEIWETAWLTNDGPRVRQFHGELSKYFGTEKLCLFNNGTLALQIGLQGLQLSGEVITTPYTFVATTHALYWNKIRPVFVDIEPEYYTLDPAKVEAAITPWTSAILAVHVYGNPCKLRALAEVARRYNLMLIYDAAHAFGVTVDGRSIGHFGDLSMFSFHATKLYHSLEGGMLMFADAGIKRMLDYLKNFGFENETEVVMPGTNAKMNEIQALMGLEVLKHVDAIIDRRREIDRAYRLGLAKVPGVRLPARPAENVKANYAYFPVEIEGKEFGRTRDQLYEELKRFNVFARRYFYPLITDYACYRSLPIIDPLKNARAAAARILTLPMYDGLSLADVEQVCAIIRSLCPNLSAPFRTSRPRAPIAARKEPVKVGSRVRGRAKLTR